MGNQSEHDIQNSIRIYLSKLGYTVFRINVGNFKSMDGRYIKSSLPKGFSDLFAIKNGKAYFIEVKTGTNKPSPEQLNFIKQMQKQGCVAGAVWSIGDVEKLLDIK
jgi:hypothetical protein